MKISFAALRRPSLRRSFGRVKRRGFSRQAALAATRRLYPAAALTPTRQAASLVAGATCIGAGVSLFLNANLGVPPYDVLISSVSALVSISHGQAAWLLSATLFLVAARLGRPPTLWGIAYVLTTGMAVDVARGLIQSPDSMALRLSFVGIGTVCIASGISLVVHAGTTGGVFELLMQAATDRGRNASRVRLCLELGVVAAGVALGGTFGVATVFFALTIAPLLRVIDQALADHAHGRRARLEMASAQGAMSASRQLEPIG